MEYLQILEKQCGIQQQSATFDFQFEELLKILNAQEKVDLWLILWWIFLMAYCVVVPSL